MKLENDCDYLILTQLNWDMLDENKRCLERAPKAKLK